MFPYIFCFLIGSCLGGWINWYVDRFGYVQRFRSPWQKSELAKRWFDFVPILGWFSLRRFSYYSTQWFWHRCFCIELFAALGTVGLYWWAVEQQMLLPGGVSKEPFETVLIRFAIHIVFFAFLLTATLTDFDDMMISDSITVCGTFFALIAAAFFPQSMLPAAEITWTNDSLFPIIAPQAIPLNGWSPNPAGNCPLIVMTLLWWFWCFAMLDRVWRFQLPVRKAFIIFCRHLYRSPRTKYFFTMAIMPVCFLFSMNNPAVFSALIGIVAGMIFIWGFRLIARYVLGIEAMGFGDVTLMGMIGAFLGWQPCLLIVFTAPFVGLVYGIVLWLLGRGNRVPYGPFLCLSAAALVVAWHFVWQNTADVFSLGLAVIGIGMLVIFVLFGVLLYLVHQIIARLH